MLHIATAHHGSPRWIPIQARELRRHLSCPCRIWASLQGIDSSYGSFFDRVVDQWGGHAEKLNHLAIEIAAVAADDDLIMFLDGDAFPIADPAPLIATGLADASLLAVRRTENRGDPQPHPCFCVTEVGTWRRLPGDWSRGFVWHHPDGAPTSDVGANLMRQLELSGTSWTPISRSNEHDLHPLFFAIYGDVVYHHGAGFRAPISRVDGAPLDAAGLPRDVPETRRIVERNVRQAEEVFGWIERDEPDWLARFI